METFTRAGLTFDVTDSGPSDGEAVILLHGFPQDRSAWLEVAPQLNAAGFRTLAPDQRGYSPGATPPGRFDYSLRELTADIVALADASGAERFHVVGHDWGGAVAWSLAGRHPDRVASATVLSTPHPAAMAWAFLHSDQVRRSWYMVTFQVPGLPEKRLHGGLRRLYTRTGLTNEQAERYLARFPSPESLTGPMNWYRSMPATAAVRRAAAQSARQAVGRIRGTESKAPAKAPRTIHVPTTYVWGSRDFALGRAAALKTAEMVSADYRFVELPGGHWLPEAHPDEVSAAIIERVKSSQV